MRRAKPSRDRHYRGARGARAPGGDDGLAGRAGTVTASATCRPYDAPCSRDGQCCSGKCSGKGRCRCTAASHARPWTAQPLPQAACNSGRCTVAPRAKGTTCDDVTPAPRAMPATGRATAWARPDLRGRPGLRSRAGLRRGARRTTSDDLRSGWLRREDEQLRPGGRLRRLRRQPDLPERPVRLSR